jgi:hypothetical protein
MMRMMRCVAVLRMRFLERVLFEASGAWLYMIR